MKRKVLVLGLVPYWVSAHTFELAHFPGFEFAAYKGNWLLISYPYALIFPKTTSYGGLSALLEKRYQNSKGLKRAISPYVILHSDAQMVSEEDLALVPTA